MLPGFNDAHVHFPTWALAQRAGEPRRLHVARGGARPDPRRRARSRACAPRIRLAKRRLGRRRADEGTSRRGDTRRRRRRWSRRTTTRSGSTRRRSRSRVAISTWTAASSSATGAASRPAFCASEAAWRFQDRHLGSGGGRVPGRDAARAEDRRRTRRDGGPRQGRRSWRARRFWQQLEARGALSLRVWQSVPHDHLEQLRALGLRAGFGSRAAADRLRQGVHGRDARLADGVDARRLGRADHERRGTGGDRAAMPRMRASLLRFTRSATGRTARRSTRSSGLATAGSPLGLRQRIEHAQLLAPEDIAALRRARGRSVGAVLARAVGSRPRRPPLGGNDRRAPTRTARSGTPAPWSRTARTRRSRSSTRSPASAPACGARSTAARLGIRSEALTVQQAFEATSRHAGLAHGRGAPARQAAPGLRRRPRRARSRPVGRPRRAGRGDDGGRPVGAQPAAVGLTPSVPTRARPSATPQRTYAERGARSCHPHPGGGLPASLWERRYHRSRPQLCQLWKSFVAAGQRRHQSAASAAEQLACGGDPERDVLGDEPLVRRVDLRVRQPEAR